MTLVEAFLIINGAANTTLAIIAIRQRRYTVEHMKRKQAKRLSKRGGQGG